MKYLVTGADGFLGRHLLAALHERSIPVRALLIGEPPAEGLPGAPECVTADITRSATLAGVAEGCTHVVHLAARVHQMHDTAADPEAAFHEVNVQGTVNLLEACSAAGVNRFLLMSSVKAMGEEEQGVFDEQSPCHPASPYGRSKLAAEKALFDFAAVRDVHAVVLRLPMVYGPGNKGNMLRLLEAAERGRKLPLGAIRNQRSMVYVGNVIDAIMRTVEHDATASQVYLVCDERPYSTRELYAAIAEAMGKGDLLSTVPVFVLKAMGLVGSVAQALLRRPMPVDRASVTRLTGDLCFDPGKLQRETGFAPRWTLREGIASTVAWHREGCPPTPPA